MHPTYRGLAFLLSLGSLPVACTRGDDEGDSTGGTPATDPTANTGTGSDATEATAPTGEPDATTTTGVTGSMDTGTSEPAPTTSTTNASVDTGDTETQPPASNPNCLAYAAKVVECSPRYAQYQENYAQQCEFSIGYALRTDGQPCADAFEAVFVCLSMATCADMEAPDTCASEQMNIPAACPSFDEDPATDTNDDAGETGVST